MRGESTVAHPLEVQRATEDFEYFLMARCTWSRGPSLRAFLFDEHSLSAPIYKTKDPSFTGG